MEATAVVARAAPRSVRRVRLVLAVAVVVSVAACGRTELVRYTVDAGVDAGFDAGHDAGFDAGVDAGVDAGLDAGPCLPRPLPLVPAVPTVMFVVDRSGSMDEDLDGNNDGGLSRWAVLQTSLATALPPHDQRIAMGALLYPSAFTFSCDAPTSVDLSPARGNAAALLGLFGRAPPRGGTPTSQAVSLAAAHLAQLHTATAARALVLATDGAPNCNERLDNATCVCTSRPTFEPNCDSPENCLDDSRTVLVIRDLFDAARVPTYVIGLGSQLNQFASTLDAMAVAGGVPRAGTPRYYSVASQAELTDALTRITAQLARCTYLLNGLGLNDTFVVEVDGAVVPEGPNGWEWLDRMNGELRLHGEACDRAASGSVATVLVDCH